MDIDVVIAWVDGTDRQWQAEKAAYEVPSAASAPNRYRDWGLLPYWFRAVETYLPWVRRIHFVTWGHVPAFLKEDHPKLRVVKHGDFIPEAYLPTFSSHAIELNLHRIPGLAEHFIYFNDDMIPLRPMSEADFFRGGLPCTNGTEVPWTVNAGSGAWYHAAVNSLGIVNRHFPKREAVRRNRWKYINTAYRWQDNLRTAGLQMLFPDSFTGFPNLHAPNPYEKRTLEAVWQAEGSALDKTCRNRFRSPEDVNQWVFLWWQVASGRFAPTRVDNLVSDITPETVDGLCSAIQNQSHSFVCLNDPEDAVDFEVLSRQLQGAFAAILPERCSYEK